MTIIVIDASFWAHAAHSSMPMLKRTDGHPIGAVFGFTRTLVRFLRRPPDAFTHIVACYDAPGETWRHRILPTYKANRGARREKQKRSSGALASQWELVAAAGEALGVKGVRMPGVEADDIVATYARLAIDQGQDVIIVSPDKDLCQLIRPGVRLWNPHPSRPKGDRWMDGGTVFRDYGILPEQIPDYLALVGDVADNIPGVPEVGPMKAAQLIREYTNVSGVISAARAGLTFAMSKIVMANIVAHAEQIDRMRTVARTHDRIDVEIDDIGAFAWSGIDFPRAEAFMHENAFGSILRQMEDSWPSATRSSGP